MRIKAEKALFLVVIVAVLLGGPVACSLTSVACSLKPVVE